MRGRMYERTKGKIDTWMQEGREERKDEKKKGSIPQVSEKGPNNQTSGAKIDPKASQNEAKIDKKIRATSSRRSWTPLGAIFRLSIRSQGAFWSPKSSQIRKKKLMQKIVDFLIGLGSKKSQKKGAKTTPKWSPRWSKIEPRKELKRKLGKV